MYQSSPLQIIKGNAIHIHLAKYGVYFVKIESSIGSKTFKAIGSNNINTFSVNTNYEKSLKDANLKNNLNIYDTDFSFETGDSLRVSVFKNGYYTRPDEHIITTSIPINFVFETSSVNETGTSDGYISLTTEEENTLAYDTITGTITLLADSEILTGNIIVIDADTTGFLRKIVEVKNESGTTVLETVQASLNEVFVDADFKLNTEFIEPSASLKSTSSAQDIMSALTDEKGYIHPVKVIYYNETGILKTKNALDFKSTAEGSVNLMDYYEDFSGTYLYGKEEDNIHFYIDEGHTSFVANAVFEFDFVDAGRIDKKTKVKIGDINSFKFYLDGNAGFKTRLALDMNASYTKEDTKKLFNFPKATAKFIIPPGVPLWITFDSDIFGHYAFDADAALHADWGFESTHTLQVGGQYELETNDFSPFQEYAPNNTIFPLNLNGEVNASARFEIFPRVDIKFYNAIGPYAEIVPFVDANYNAAYQSQTTSTGTETFLAWNSDLDLGLDFRLGVGLKLLGYNKDFGPTVINAFNTPLWRSPETIEILTELPTEADEGTVLSLTYMVTDLINLPVSLCPVYIEGDGSFNKQLALTDSNGEVTFDWTLNGAGDKSVAAYIYNTKETIIDQIDASILSVYFHNYNSFSDSRDGQTYNSIEIGSQTWMAENLKYLPAVVGPVTGSNTDSYYYVYDYYDTIVAEAKATKNYSNYGVLYNWTAALNACPSGWHLPSDDEWSELTNYLINNGFGYDGSGDDIGKSMSSNNDWTISSVYGAIGFNQSSNNSSGLNIIPAGLRHTQGLLSQLGDAGYYWASTESSDDISFYRHFYYSIETVDRSIFEKNNGCSIRCVKDDENSDRIPVAQFSSDKTSVYVGESVNFIDESINEPTAWLWNFGDGETSTVQHPTHIYNVVGAYAVSLTVTNEYGENTETKNDYISVIENIPETGTFTDSRDGQEYNTIKIGNQTWFAENLNYETSYSYWYDNSSVNGDVFGRLYTMEVAINACPAGWHLPSDEEWKTLEMELGMSQTTVDELGCRGTDEGIQMRSTSGWYNEGNGTNSSGFNALPGGLRNYYNEGFHNISLLGYWWTSTAVSGTTNYWMRNIETNSDCVTRAQYERKYALSVRCIEDDEIGEGIPVADFSAKKTIIYIGDSISFIDESIREPATWLWNFGDGETSTAQHPTHKYNAEGTYAVSLTVTNEYGEDTETKNNYINVITSIPETGTFTDIRDGQVYSTIKIGIQTWMSENLKYLPTVSESAMESYTEPYYYVYGYDSTNVSAAKATENFATYGVLYNWPAACSSCPSGWHLPTEEEWQQLEVFLGLSKFEAEDSGWRGTDQGNQMKSTTGWYENDNANNSSGFTALPGGLRVSGGAFLNQGLSGTWWSSSVYGSVSAWYRNLVYSNANVNKGNNRSNFGHSVRCIKD